MVTVCQPGPIAGQHSNEAYGGRITGKGDPHHVRQNWSVVFGGCGSELATVSMADSLQTHHESSVWARPLPHLLLLTTPK